ncbi:MAG: hypothetical protein CL526_05685 [Aequorivita sp.]|nr:hypothetical protein [Aequorivita sp.]|tara:strand:- start:41029 stop:41787 length:759 start_codon:yes stop_codon:yes gene_type:complete
MFKNLLLLAITTLLFVGCSSEKEIEISSQSFTEKELEICQDEACPEVTINYVKINGDSEVSKTINHKIKNFIITSLLMGEETKPTAQDIRSAVKGFVEVYFSDKNQFPNMAGEYFAEITINEIYVSENIISFEMSQYLYTGGAHGYGRTTFLNVNPKTGDTYTFSELFQNKEEFISVAEKKFREQQNISENQGINDTKFWFKDDAFHLPESVGFTQDSLIFIYNQYEIASYADGPIELKIARKEATPYLTIQ